MTQFCGKCKHGDFPLTPTGRAKRDSVGSCRKAIEIEKALRASEPDTMPSCMSMDIHVTATLPHFGTKCKCFEAKEDK